MIIIEGIISAGKTTLAKELALRIRRPKLFLEPVKDNPYLEKFYKDKSRWSLEMQYWLMAKRFKMHQDGIEYEWNTGGTSVYDRSIYGDGIFAKVLNEEGHIDDIGYKSYLQHKACMERFLLVPQQVIFLDVPVDLALKRIPKRNRDCEQGSAITREYLEKLRHEYNNLLQVLGQKTKVDIINWEDGMSADDIKSIIELNFNEPVTSKRAFLEAELAKYGDKGLIADLLLGRDVTLSQYIRPFYYLSNPEMIEEYLHIIASNTQRNSSYISIENEAFFIYENLKGICPGSPALEYLKKKAS